MIELSVIRDLVAIFGVIAGLTYYVLTVRNAQKARQAQMILPLYESRFSPEGIYRFWRIMLLNFDSFEDYMRKWGPYEHPEVTEELRLITASWSFYDGLGKLLKDNMLDVNTVYDLLGVRSLMVWYKYEMIIKNIRIMGGAQAYQKEGAGLDYMKHFEYLADEMARLRLERGINLPVSWLHQNSTLRQELNL
jgi:hypothetical protein